MGFFRKATRSKSKLRLGIVGPAGSGKTYSALLIAKGIGGRVAVVDTENGSADLYANMMEYDTLPLTPPYTVDKAIKAIEAAEAEGYDILILDSISHYWAGEGGLLDWKDKLADTGKFNDFTAWRRVSPVHNRFIEKMLGSNLHLIATMRAKTEYVVQSDDRGKAVPKKVGLAPVQREGMDYEFTLVLDVDYSHNATSSKDRTSLFDGKIFVPSVETGETLKKWLETGGEAPPDTPFDAPATVQKAPEAVTAPAEQKKATAKPKSTTKKAEKSTEEAPKPPTAAPETKPTAPAPNTSGSAGAPPTSMTEEQGIHLKHLMMTKGITDSKKQKEFFEYVRAGGLKTYSLAQQFIDKFEAYYTLWSKASQPQEPTQEMPQ